MTNQQTLEKARNKATENGWTGSPFIDSANQYAKLVESKMLTDVVYGENWWELVVLFMPPHDFAKALWPNDKNGNIYWRMHLQRMVVSDDPIKYLEENI